MKTFGLTERELAVLAWLVMVSIWLFWLTCRYLEHEMDMHEEDRLR